MYYQLTKSVKTQLIMSLREAFQRSTNYFFSDDDEETRIFIGDVYTYGVTFENTQQPMKYLPALLVSMNSSTSFEYSPSQIQGMMYDEEGKQLAQSFGGGIEGSYTITIAAESTLEREELTDLVFMIFNYVSRSDLLNRGVLVRKVSVGGESEEPYGNDYIYIGTVTLETLTEWGELVSADRIEKIFTDAKTFYDQFR